MAGGGQAVNARLGSPPRPIEWLLERILVGADSQTVIGDLHEEYAEAVRPRLGRVRADIWYLRQVLSLVPRGVLRQGRMRRALLAASLFTLGSCCWLAVMEWVLRHSGYLFRSAMDVSIAAVPLATVAALLLHVSARAERWLWAGAVALIAVGAQTLIQNTHSPHFEGFVFLISVAITVEGALMLLSLGRSGEGTHRLGRGSS
jgi:hypothetical protein